MRKTARLLLFPILLSAWAPPAWAGDVHVAVAANFLGPMRKIARKFEEKTGVKVTISSGSTGQLYSQIINGAPYDLFFAADKKRPRSLEEVKAAAPGSRFTYATGRLALYSADKEMLKGSGDIPANVKIRSVAMANPKTAPYGFAAAEAMGKLALFKRVRPKRVYGTSVSQAFQFAASGSADLGLVALSQVLEYGGGSYHIVPESMYTPIEQQAVLLRRGAGNRAAAGLIEFVSSSEARRLIESLGYSNPSSNR